MNYFNYDLKFRDYSHLIFTYISSLKEGRFVGGSQVSEFECNFANYVESDAVIGCANGLDAIRLSIRTLKLPANSKIAVSAHTFFATWLAILEEGHIPVGVDADINNGQMDLVELLAVLNSHPDIAAVIYVHMHGIAGEIENISEVCKAKSIALIEDCAQAHGLRINGKHVGTFGEFGAFSFYPTKNLPAFGDAGSVVTSATNEEIVRSFANYGWHNSDRDKHWKLGLNSRLDSIQAGILSYWIKRLDGYNKKRILIASMYHEAIQGSKNLKSIGLGRESVWHHFPLLTSNRSEFLKFLESREIPFQIHYKTACHLQPVIRNIPKTAHYKEGDFPHAEKLANEIVSLPNHPWMKKAEICKVKAALRDWVAKNG